jgi:hypothetical protein
MGGRNIAPLHRRCDAPCKDGHACRSWRMRYQRRCRMHGGSSPQARRKAKQREASQKGLHLTSRWYEREAERLRRLEDDR